MHLSKPLPISMILYEATVSLVISQFGCLNSLWNSIISILVFEPVLVDLLDFILPMSSLILSVLVQSSIKLVQHH